MNEKTEVIKYYSTISGIYERARLGFTKGKIISNLQIGWFMRNLGNKNSICLEIGCGTGRITRILARRTNLLVAIDASLEMVKINKSAIGNKLKNKIEYVLSDASHLPFRDESFENIIGARLYWHILEYTKALGEALRTLKIRKHLLFDFPCTRGPFSLYSKLHRIKHDVLTLFIGRNEIKQIFKRANNLIISSNTSLLLFLMPNKILGSEIIQKLIWIFEQFQYAFLKDWFYSYYLIKVTK
jgi:ubiquinone/menaquinone biosynthesis C-methylase UbiE